MSDIEAKEKTELQSEETQIDSSAGESVQENDMEIQREELSGENEKSVRKKKDIKKIIFIALGSVAILVAVFFIGRAISITKTFNEQKDFVSNMIVSDNYDSEQYKEAINGIANNVDVSDNKKAKAFFELGVEAVEHQELKLYKGLFNKSIKKNEEYKKLVIEQIGNALKTANEDKETLSYAEYYISLGGELDEATLTKIKAYVLKSVVVDKFDEYNKKLEKCVPLGFVADDEVQEKIYTVATKAYNEKNYPEAYKWFNIYKGKKDIKAKLQESTYEYVVQVLFGGVIYDDIDDRGDWARKMLSTEDMKNYKQSEGIRLYCNLEDAALEALVSSNSTTLGYSAQQKIKDRLLYPSTYKFLGRRTTSDFYMKKGDTEDKAYICYDFDVVYSAMNLYGYTVTDTISFNNNHDFNLDGSDYILAVKIFHNFSDKDMLKYARTGKFTNTKITFEY